MRILLIGSGGREHALAWALAGSPLCQKLFAAPGNPGIAREAECVAIAPDDRSGLVAFAKSERIDLAVVGPETPLVNGLVDRLEDAGIAAFGPSAAAARLEGSKAFTKELCDAAGIPTAHWRRFRDPDAAKDYVRAHGAPIVVKADGLAAGKGVTVAATIEDAVAAIDAALIAHRFGAAGGEIVIEECLAGEEASLLALCDGRHVLPLPSARDYKRVGEGDTGPNTGGMGALSPAPTLSPQIETLAVERIIRPAVAAMAARGTPFKGVLYAGLMVTKDGPKLIEFNVRFGDPECQVLLPRLKSDLLPALVAAHDGDLADFDLRWDARPSVCVVMAARGYPGPPTKGGEIKGLAEAASDPLVAIFEAGTRRDDEGRLIADGGRVLDITAIGDTIEDARRRAYDAIARIDWPDGFCRRDIGLNQDAPSRYPD
ncbi:MAG: phosphoribosylamine--glycine ligase [Stellaceae bacterium]